MGNPINPDETPEAPAPTPTLSLYMRVVENDAADDFEGGRLLLKPVAGNRAAHPDLIDASLVMSAASDAFLVQFPWKTRAEKQVRFYKVTIEEVPAAEVPEDPDLVARRERLQRELAALPAATEG